MYHRKSLLFFICCISSFLCVGQNAFQQSIDSLYIELNKNPHDTSKVDLLLSLSNFKMKTYDFIESKILIDRAASISDSIGYQKGSCLSLLRQGRLFWFINDNEAALECNLKALTISKKLNQPNLLAANYTSLCHDYIFFEDCDNALMCAQNGLVINQGLNNSEHLAKNLNLIGFVYMLLEDYPEAEKYYDQSYQIAIQSKDESMISGFCADLASLYQKQNKLNKALVYGEKALIAASNTGDLRHISQSYNTIEGIYIELQDFQKAYETRVKKNDLGLEINNANASAKIKEIEQKNDFDKERVRQEAIQEQKDFQQKIIRNAIGILLLAAIIFLFVSYRQSLKLKKEKERSESLLLNILPENIAEELKTYGKAEARDFDMVSILFTDFKDFTRASEKLTAQELVSEINSCFEAFDGITGKYHIEKIKTIGDAYMAAGGLSITADDSLKKTILAALEMQAFIGNRKSDMDARNKPSFEMRVGIHTGPVVAGIVGVKKFQYDIWGDTVNTAARMESNGKVGKVNISQATYDLLKNDPDFTFENRGKIEAKGKGVMEMYFVSLKNKV